MSIQSFIDQARLRDKVGATADGKNYKLKPALLSEKDGARKHVGTSPALAEGMSGTVLALVNLHWEWAVIKSAPYSFAFTVLAVGAVVFVLVRWYYDGIVSRLLLELNTIRKPADPVCVDAMSGKSHEQIHFPIPVGYCDVTITFANEKTSPNWTAEGLALVWEGRDLREHVGIAGMTRKTTTGFTVHLTGVPSCRGYYLEGRVVDG